MWHILVVAVLAVSVASKTSGGGTVNPAAIMEDIREAPRFQVKILGDLLADSELPKKVAELSSGHSDEVLAQSNVVYDPLVLRVGRTWRMLCQMPRVNDTLSEDTVPEEEDVDPVVAVKRGEELLEPLKDRCLTYAGGWWTFEYCHNQYVRQFHALGPDKSGNTQEIEFRLGLHSKRMELYDDEKVRRIGRSRYLTQVWGGGTLCDMTREPRDVEIEYHCDPHGPERIAMVEEVEVCSYAMIINTPRLCADPMFYDTAASAVYDIKCQHVLADAEYAKVMADRAALRLQMDSAEPGGEAAAAADDDDDEVPLAQVLASSASAKKKEKKKEKDAQVVVSMNDPELGQLSKGSQEKLRKLMAIAYDAPRLRVHFAEATHEAESK
ncbi:Protein OS-9 [Coemansia pectinata]|uniref:Protein OS-9 homolog n=1 Tax=Coemansia pectinata TaxID=1052879 RepID=A0A9W8GTN8_9FUNG|nr:Protein OS-9 [Coemansia pectinata]